MNINFLAAYTKGKWGRVRNEGVALEHRRLYKVMNTRNTYIYIYIDTHVCIHIYMYVIYCRCYKRVSYMLYIAITAKETC